MRRKGFGFVATVFAREFFRTRSKKIFFSNNFWKVRQNGPAPAVHTLQVVLGRLT